MILSVDLTDEDLKKIRNGGFYAVIFQAENVKIVVMKNEEDKETDDDK